MMHHHSNRLCNAMQRRCSTAATIAARWWLQAQRRHLDERHADVLKQRVLWVQGVRAAEAARHARPGLQPPYCCLDARSRRLRQTTAAELTITDPISVVAASIHMLICL